MHEESRPSKEPGAGESHAESGEVAAEGSTAHPANSLAEAQAETARLKDAWLRSVADFDNFRKRTRRELDEARRAAREEVVRALLPVFDNLERALQSAQRSSDVKAMAEGLTMVQRQFVEALGREGIARVPTIGHSFDPGIHEAIQQVETDEHPPGTIIAEVQPGYLQAERLLRAAMVVVARAKSAGGGVADRSLDPSN
ncbi:MAG: nucleotide exchange factor GrpE [Polyangiaceae bacterium]|jgi:molecular chaperone GrpE